jgi:hypothetical protein
MNQKQLVFVVAYEAESHLPELFDRMRKAGIEEFMPDPFDRGCVKGRFGATCASVRDS